MRFASLFGGIEGFGLGLEGLGAELIWQAEIEEFPRRVTAARFPAVELLPDVHDVDAGAPPVVGISGGFPCQDLSLAGLGAGLAGARSGLWGEFFRVIGLLEPEVVLAENVPPLLHRGMDKVVYDLCSAGYAVEWDCLPAASFGAPHLRDRVWIVAHRLGGPCVFGDPAGLFPAPIREPGEEGWRRWPRAGFATDPDYCLELRPLAPLSEAKRGICLPTPAAVEYGSSQNGINSTRPSAGTPSLSTMARQGLWPTALASDAAGGRRATANGYPWDGKEGESLLDAVLLERWPTPEASDGSGGRVGPELGGTRPSGAKRAISLANAAVHAERRYPTPMAADAERTSDQGPRHYAGGGDNPTLLGAARRAERAGCGCLLEWVDADGFCACCQAHLDDPAGHYAVQGDGSHTYDRCPARRDAQRFPTPHGVAGGRADGGYDGHGNELSMAVRVAEGLSDSERSAARLPTPVARDWKGSGMRGQLGTAAAEGFPTPQASDGTRGPDYARADRDGPGGDDLTTAVAKLPTPRASDGHPKSRGDLIAHVKGRPNSHHPGEREGRGERRVAGLLNPSWVDGLMGFPIGWTDPEIPNEQLEWAWWAAGEPEPEGLARITTDRRYRRERLTALGNALVPVAPRWVFARYLSARERLSVR